jgi:hypothetical protein
MRNDYDQHFVFGALRIRTGHAMPQRMDQVLFSSWGGA